MWALRSATTKPRQGNRGQTGKDAAQTSNSGRNIRFLKAQTNRLRQAEKAPSKASGPWRQSNTIVQPAESEMVSAMNRTNSKHKKSLNDSDALKVPSFSTHSHRMREPVKKYPVPATRVRREKTVVAKTEISALVGTPRQNNQLKEEPIPGSEITCRRSNYNKKEPKNWKKDATHARKEQEKKR